MNSNYFLGVTALVLILTSGVVSAGYMNITYSGEIDYVLTDSGTGAFNGTGVGSVITSSSQYGLNDSDAAITPHSDNETDYLFSGSPYGSQISGGTSTASTDQAIVVASNGTPLTGLGLNELGLLAGMTITSGDLADVWTVRTEDSINNIEFGISVFSLDDLNWQTNELFTSLPPLLSESDLTAFFILETNVAGDVIYFALGEVDSLTFTAVPLPSVFWLFGSGLLGLVSIAKRKNS